MTHQSLGFLLHQCSKLKSLRSGLPLHAAVLKSGIQDDTTTSNHLVNMYAKCGHLISAHKLFGEMPERNIVSWSALVSGYAQSGHPSMAMDMYARMASTPNEFILASVISACGTSSISLQNLKYGQQVHAQGIKFGYGGISFVSGALITLYMKFGRCDDAVSVFETSSEHSLVSYNAMITGFVENKKYAQGIEFFRSLYQQGFVPDRYSFSGVLSACTETDDFKLGLALGLHCQTIQLNLDATPFVGNVIMTMYSRFQLLEEAERAFSVIDDKDIISWNTIISACAVCGDHIKGMNLLRELVKGDSTLRPDHFTFASALTVCAGVASISHGKQIHAHLIRTWRYQDVALDNALINMYAKCGCIGYSINIFNHMGCGNVKPRRNLISWNSVIYGCGNHGLGELALELFEQMKKEKMTPDSLTLTAVLVACNHAGLVNEGMNVFDSTVEVYGIKPEIEHVSCLIDMLGRSGRLDEAEEYMKIFFLSVEDDPVVLGSLLSACRLHGQVVVGERVIEQLKKLQPVSTSPFVLLSNLYASDKTWQGVANARMMMKASGLKKEPGHSLIEVNGVIEKFTVGDLSHSRIAEIDDTLRHLNCIVERKNYTLVETQFI